MPGDVFYSSNLVIKNRTVSILAHTVVIENLQIHFYLIVAVMHSVQCNCKAFKPFAEHSLVRSFDKLHEF